MARERGPDFDDLRGIDLSRLDLDHIELEIDEPPSQAGRWLALFLVLTSGGALIWLPTTDWYQAMGQTHWVFFALCSVAVIVGIAGGRTLWDWVQDAAARYAARASTRRPTSGEPEGPPSAVTRWLLLLFALGGAGFVLFGLPRMGYAPGGPLDALWFGAAIVAVVVGLILGRWLLMQAAAAPPSPRREPIRVPPWFKWVTLTALLAAGLVALVAPSLLGGSEGESLRFTLGGVGFGVGVLGAIWIARRFDETETRLREQAQRARRPGVRG